MRRKAPKAELETKICNGVAWEGTYIKRHPGWATTANSFVLLSLSLLRYLLVFLGHIQSPLATFGCNVMSSLKFNILAFLGSRWPFWGLWYNSNTVLSYTHVAEQLLFSMLSSILIFYFGKILGLVFGFLGPQCAVFWNWGFKKYALGVYSSGLTTFTFYASSDSCS